jgi:hypothetical protein
VMIPVSVEDTEASIKDSIMATYSVQITNLKYTNQSTTNEKNETTALRMKFPLTAIGFSRCLQGLIDSQTPTSRTKRKTTPLIWFTSSELASTQPAIHASKVRVAKVGVPVEPKIISIHNAERDDLVNSIHEKWRCPAHGKLGCFVDERGQHFYLIPEMKLIWADWIVDASQSGLLHLLTGHRFKTK